MNGVSWASQSYPINLPFILSWVPVYLSPFVHQGGAVVQAFRDFQPLTLQHTRAPMDNQCPWRRFSLYRASTKGLRIPSTNPRQGPGQIT